MPGLYPAVLGESFTHLSPLVRAFHLGVSAVRARGVFRVERSRHWLGRLVGWLVGFPPAGENVDLRLQVELTAQGERWSRSFGGAMFVSEQWRDGAHLVERFGTTEIRFTLIAEGGALLFTPVKQFMRLGPLRLPMPSLFAPSVSARVVEDGQAIRSDIVIRSRLFGLLVRYGGRLELE